MKFFMPIIYGFIAMTAATVFYESTGAEIFIVGLLGMLYGKIDGMDVSE